MRRLVLGCGAAMVLAAAGGCGLGWKHRGGALTLPESRFHAFRNGRPPGDAGGTGSPAAQVATPPCRVSLTLPAGWNWVMRGDDLVATRDGVFLQNIVVERIHVDQVTQSLGAFPFAALSSKQWPVRTVKSMKRRFAPGMSPAEAADVLLESRRNDPGIASVAVREVAAGAIAGTPAFRAVFDFRLATPDPPASPARMPLYRSVYYGFVRDKWFYGVGYTAALRHYFQKDSETFESVLRSVTLADR